MNMIHDLDGKIKELSNEVNSKYSDLRECVENTIVKLNVVNLYPDCTEQFSAITRLDRSKKGMIKILKDYKKSRDIYIKFLEEHKDEISNYTNYVRQYPEPYICVENFYRNFINK